MLQAGTQAPDFTVKNQDGQEVSLSQFRGRKVVLYFYPKDDTPGCTAEACEFRDRHAGFEKLDAVVLGVSKDSEKSHVKFRKKFDLPFQLLADTELDIHQKYGTWMEKKMYGRTYMGTQRATFIIDSRGVIRQVYADVKPEGHAAEVESFLATID